MAESILVTGKKISAMELVTNVQGNEKIPTGQPEDLAITPNQIKDFVIEQGDLIDQTQLETEVSQLQTAIANTLNQSKSYTDTKVSVVSNALASHLNDQTNPHQVTKEQVGLGDVDNTSDADKPVSNAVLEALSQKADIDEVYPRSSVYTKSEVDSKLLEKVDAQDYDQIVTQLKKGVPFTYNSDFSTEIGGYPIGSRLILDNGDLVKNVTSNNTNNPNQNMLGWRLADQKDLIFSTQTSFLGDGVFDNLSLFNSVDLSDKNLVIGAGSYFVSDSVTIRCKSLTLLDGAKITAPFNKTITFDCPLHLSKSDHFSSECKYILTKKCQLESLFLEWWGGRPDNTTDNIRPINKLFTSVASGTFPKKLSLLAGTYAFSGKFQIPQDFHVIGQKPINFWYTNTSATSYSVLRGYGDWTGSFIEMLDLAVLENVYIVGSDDFTQFNTKLQSGLLISGVSCVFRYVSGAYWGLEGLKVTGGIVYGDTGYWNNCCTAGKDINGLALTSYQGCVTLNGTDNCIRAVHGGSKSDELTSTGWVAGILVGGGSSCRYSDLVGENADFGVVIKSLYSMYINLRPERCSKNALILDGDYNSITNMKVGMQVGTSSVGNIDAIIVNGSSNKISNVISDVYNNFRHFIVDNRTSLGDGDARYGNYYSGLPTYEAGSLPANIRGELLKHNGSAIYENKDRHTDALIDSSGNFNVQNYSYVRFNAASPTTLNALTGGYVSQRILISSPSVMTIKNGSIKTLTNADYTLQANTCSSFIKLTNNTWLQEF